MSNLVFSGIQPTGNLHLGNYLGAVKNWVSLQKSHDCIFCIVDLHAITLWQEPQLLKQHVREVAAAMLASGIDNEKHILFSQSQNANHAELAWIFNCVSRMGWLNRMTQFKEKAGKDRENASVGLFTYPNLMSADILLYKANLVPVGDDQKQHLELARDIAQKFNNDYSPFFPIPEPLIIGPATRVMSLRDGTKKMSKSDISDYSRINLTDDESLIALKFKKAKTDALPIPDTLEDLKNRPEAKNLLSIWAALSNHTLEQAISSYAGSSFSVFKKDLTDLAISTLSPITSEIKNYLNDPYQIDKILYDGAIRAKEISKPILKNIHEIIGFSSL
jgi:tryptophanyl-tRNA synthetase